MKRLFLSVLSAVLALTMILPAAAPVMADSEKDDQAQPAAKAVLMVTNSNVVDVGQSVTITVSERHDHSPVAGAAVYAKKAKDIQPIIAAARKLFRVNKVNANDVADTAQYVAEMQQGGILLGYTDDEGKVAYTFADSGTYVLIAIKDDYTPGFAKMNVTLGDQKKLGIKAPSSAEVDKPVTIKVIERNTGDPVAEAVVYALKIDNAKGYIPYEPPSDNGTTSTTAVERYVALAVQNGSLIGYTDNSSELVNTFTETGRYILVTTKDGYEPGFAHIVITPVESTALHIKAPAVAAMGQSVTINVTERNTDNPVAGASVYALKWNAMPAPIPTDNGTATQILTVQPTYAAEADKYAAMAQDAGFLIGSTDSNGQVSYTFNDAGRYTLVAIKDGYKPDLTTIDIRADNMQNPERIERLQPTPRGIFNPSHFKKPK